MAGQPEIKGFATEKEALQKGKQAATKLYPGLQLTSVRLTIYWQAESQPRPFLKDFCRAFYSALGVPVYFIQR
jgi:hypothetical protein